MEKGSTDTSIQPEDALQQPAMTPDNGKHSNQPLYCNIAAAINE